VGNMGFTAPGTALGSADASDQVVRLIDIGVDPDVGLIDVTGVDRGPDIGVAIASGDHELFDGAPQLLGCGFGSPGI
jgi:hypothetical protein